MIRKTNPPLKCMWKSCHHPPKAFIASEDEFEQWMQRHVGERFLNNLCDIHQRYMLELHKNIPMWSIWKQS